MKRKMANILFALRAKLHDCIFEIADDHAGMGTVEVILIIVVLVGLVVIFKAQLNNIVSNLFQKIVTQTSGI